MRYAEVSVNSPIARRRTFSYAIPPDMTITAGQAVLVPFGERTLQGIVIELTRFPAVEDTREILGVIEEQPLLSPRTISLARRISDYYLSPLFDAVSLFLPPGFERKAVTFVSQAQMDIDVTLLSDEQRRAMDLAVGEEGVAAGVIEKALGKKRASAVVSQLVRKGLLTRRYELGDIRVRPKREIYIKLNPAGDISRKLAVKQQALIDFLGERSRPVPLAEARAATGCSRATAVSLERKGLVMLEETDVRREPISYNNITSSRPLSLTAAQEAAFTAIKSGLRGNGGGSASPAVFLLHGVTGSGKTEVYLRALAEAVKRGGKGIVLVPEIALTPQTIERFAARFPHRVAVLHSRLSLGEQYDEWHRIRNGEFDVVIGSRSAIFAPQPDLGLVIIDEEHEWTYKQDNSPHYHARDVAVMLAEAAGATVVLGSATPDIESYHKSKNGEYTLLELPERVVPFVGAVLPEVEVVDMRDELKAGNRGMFSRSLSEAINDAVAAGEQVILYLNRRGGSTFIQCRRCGHVLRCRRCDVPLTHHIAGDMLTCHQCNYRLPVPAACPKCGNRNLRFLGAGTQKLEQEVQYTFPRARHLRWDSDTTTRKSAHDDLLNRFRGREAEILIGTQMVAKGLDIPSVTLVGVVNADTNLNLPDFRAGERTFQLLSQVAGRAGRGESGGRVIVQTFSPDHYAVRAAAGHDYAAFYEREIAYRSMLHNPPFARLARLVYSHTNDAACRREAERVKTVLEGEMETRGIGGISLIGPAPAFTHRLRGRYRWQLVLRGAGLSAFLSPVALPQGWTTDIDPMTML